MIFQVNEATISVNGILNVSNKYCMRKKYGCDGKSEILSEFNGKQKRVQLASVSICATTENIAQKKHGRLIR